ncbi:S-adenosylmethionine decarboxylase proenzyme [candidate division KSB1 bacterium]|nr:S-adenosylmethionine decarboxylase proenzyme [candidate division KSB1 bacterium]
MNALGKSVLIEYYGCNRDILNDGKMMEELLLDAVRVSGATLIDSVFHKFSPHGISGVVVIAESHFSVHTWPEYGYCAVDVFTCGEDIDTGKAISFLKEKFAAESLSIVGVDRGVLDVPEGTLKHK